MSLPCNPSNEDQDSEWEEPPFMANSERFTTVLIGLCVEEYHTKECLHGESFVNFRLTLRFKLGNMPPETKVPGRKNIVMAAILKFKVGVMERNTYMGGDAHYHWRTVTLSGYGNFGWESCDFQFGPTIRLSSEIKE